MGNRLTVIWENLKSHSLSYTKPIYKMWNLSYLNFANFFILCLIFFSWANINFHILETEGRKNKLSYCTSPLLSEYNDCPAACLGRCGDKQAMEVHISWHVSLILLEIQWNIIKKHSCVSIWIIIFSVNRLMLDRRWTIQLQGKKKSKNQRVVVTNVLFLCKDFFVPCFGLE